MNNNPTIGYVVFVISEGVCNSTHFNLLTPQEAREYGLHLIRKQYDKNVKRFPKWEDTEKEELTRREEAVNLLRSVDLSEDDDLIIMPVKNLHANNTRNTNT